MTDIGETAFRLTGYHNESMWSWDSRCRPIWWGRCFRLPDFKSRYLSRLW